MTTILETINSPADLKKLSMPELKQLANELRTFIIDNVSKTGGHLSSSLGTVELAIAIHYVFDTPEDRLVWDVGHQAYAHKILTGRRDRMSTLRQYKGLSGFPKRSESPYDCFGTGHSSTSISAILGMAVAAKTLGKKGRSHIAVIGDGAMTAGMVFEALNCAGDMKDLRLLVILNDNDCSISPPVGALKNHFTQLMSGQFYAQARDIGKAIVRPFPKLFDLTKRAEEYSKGMVAPHSTLFEEFGMNYHGPIDGHDLEVLIPVLQNMKQLNGPLVLHVVTQKGHGYAPAVDNPTKYHGISPFDSSKGIVPSPHAKTYTEVFSDWLVDIARKDPGVIAITPAMKEGSGLVAFAKEFPNRFFDVAIAEQHAATFAAGLAADLRDVAAAERLRRTRGDRLGRHQPAGPRRGGAGRPVPRPDGTAEKGDITWRFARRAGCAARERRTRPGSQRSTPMRARRSRRRPSTASACACATTGPTAILSALTRRPCRAWRSCFAARPASATTSGRPTGRSRAFLTRRSSARTTARAA